MEQEPPDQTKPPRPQKSTSAKDSVWDTSHSHSWWARKRCSSPGARGTYPQIRAQPGLAPYEQRGFWRLAFFPVGAGRPAAREGSNRLRRFQTKGIAQCQTSHSPYSGSSASSTTRSPRFHCSPATALGSPRAQRCSPSSTAGEPWAQRCRVFGSPELLLGRPLHIYEPVCAAGGGDVGVRTKVPDAQSFPKSPRPETKQ